MSGAELLEGLLPLALTWGLPSRAACMLAQSGLSSREMITALLADFPADFATSVELTAWVADVNRRVSPAWFRDHVSAQMWREFALAMAQTSDAAWVPTEVDAEVDWASGVTVPTTGQRLRVLYDETLRIGYVCDDELATLGTVSAPPPAIVRGYASHAYREPTGRLRVVSFGPRR